MVAIYHFTYRWSSNFFYEDLVSHDSLRVFIMGVQLFFIISGYVIFKTIENTQNFQIYIFKRIKRLVPTLILVVPLLFLLQKLLVIENFPKLNLIDIPVSITILNPTYIAFLFHVPTNFVTGVMWTLTYEITFYLIIGFIYFYISKKNALPVFVMLLNTILILNYSYLFLSDKLGEGYSNPIPNYPSFEYVVQQSGILHLSWFGVGMWFYKYEGMKLKYYPYVILINLLILVTYDSVGGTSLLRNLKLSLLSLVITFSFLIFFIINFKGNMLFTKYFRNVLAKIGNVSYEFYLIHEVVGVFILSFISSLNFVEKRHFLILFFLPLVIYILIILSYRVQLLTSKIFRQSRT
jgi:peptidoglycan/LPS O-acetylase OafA/YrhL